MSENPTVSIIIPVYNDNAGLLACLDALARQTYEASRLQVLVVDNGSTPPMTIDGTYPYSLKLLRCGTAGSYAARNAGAAVADGAVLAFTDADCLPGQRWIENGIAALQTHAAEVAIGGEVTMTTPAIPTATSAYQQISGFQQRENIELRGFSATANLFCTRQTFDSVGPFDQELLSGGDREWCWRARAHGVRMVYAAGAIVSTLPRTSLRGAIRQARRVAAGRRSLSESASGHAPSNGLKPHRSPLQSLQRILRRPGLTLLDRLKVLAVAAVIWASVWFERVRLHLGGLAERR